MRRLCAAAAVAICAALSAGAAAHAQEIVSVYTTFDADRSCRHTPGKDEEDYGAWRCPGYGGLIVHLTAGDQRMQVSFGTSARNAADELAAEQTFPGFNSVYSGTVEWRIEKQPNGKMRPFATILRWNTRTEADAARDDGTSTGRTLVVTRLNPGGVCHVGYVDARAPGANETARKLADAKARSFRCDQDKAE
jgi:opacity protein-like surface antigen